MILFNSVWDFVKKLSHCEIFQAAREKGKLREISLKKGEMGNLINKRQNQRKMKIFHKKWVFYTKL